MTDPQVFEAASRFLVRYFRSGIVAPFSAASVHLQDDLEYLRIQWALSHDVTGLVAYLLTHRHETQATLGNVLVDGEGGVRGRLAPVRTAMRQRVSGNSALVSYYEPRRQHSDGPNHVLAWLLASAFHVINSHSRMLGGSETYKLRVELLLKHLHVVRQFPGIGEAIAAADLRRRPSHHSIAQAGRSRRPLYKRAFAAYQRLLRIEAGSSSDIEAVCADSVLGPLDEWQVFELLLALKVLETLAEHSGAPLHLHPLEPGSQRPVGTAGPYEVYWQSLTPYADASYEREPSELLAAEVLRSYNVQAGVARPDIVVINRRIESVVAIAEAKYHSGKWTDGFRDAVEQVVRYTRHYTSKVPRPTLLSQSLIALRNLPPERRALSPPDGAPVLIGLQDALEGTLQQWLARLPALD